MRRRIPLLADLPREVAVLASIAFFVALGFGIVIPAIPIFAKTFDVSAFAASAVIAVFALMRLVTSPLAGILTDRVGERLTLTSGLAIVAVSSVLAGLAQSYPQLLVLRGIGGLGSSMFTVSATALLLRVTEPAQRGRASAAFQGGFLFGGVAGPAVGGLVLAWSVRAPFFVYAGTLAIATLVAAVFLTGRRVQRLEEAAAAAQGPAADPSQPDPRGWAELRAALSHAAYRAALGVNLLTGLATFGLRAALVPLFVIEGLRQGAGLSGAAFLVAAATQAIVLLPAGRTADFTGRRPALLYGTSATLVGMLGLVVADLIAGNVTPATVVFFSAMAVLGVGTAFLGSAPAAVVGDVMGGRRGGIVIAAFQMVSDLGAVLGPLIAGLLLDALGFNYAFGVGAVAAALALLLVLAMPETLRPTPGTSSGGSGQKAAG